MSDELINGKLFDWSDVTVQLPSGISVGLTEISYNDSLGIEFRYGKGNLPRGYGSKNYEAAGAMTLDKDEADTFRENLGGTVFRKPFTVIVSYATEGGSPVTDTLKQCIIEKQDTSGKQGDANVGAVKYDFKIGKPIEWNGSPAVTNT